jgi:hypothetical protein
MGTVEVKDEERPPASIDDFRACSAAFSQLTGVLGGFCITVLVLVLDSSTLGRNEFAQDWIVGLILFVAMSYIFSSGVLANSMNAVGFQRRFKVMGEPPGRLYTLQRNIFAAGLFWFHVGNVLLTVSLLILVLQYSLKIGLGAMIVIAAFAIRVVYVNIRGQYRTRKRLARLRAPGA